MASYDDYLKGDGGGDPTATAAVPWWKQPPPPGYTGQWPPPLPPGGSYGAAVGQINYATPPTDATPPTGSGQSYWDPTLNAGQGGWSTTGLTAAPGAPDSSFYTGPGAGAPTSTTPPPAGGGGGGYSGGGLPSPFTSPFVAPTKAPMPGVPTFTPPTATPFTYDKFSAPSMNDVLNDPGYQLPLQQGLGAISNDAAARGLWATGGTGKAFQDYAQNYAASKYGDIYNRALNTYETNFGNALGTYSLNNNIAFRDAQAAFQPQLIGYETNAAATQRANEFDWNAAFQKWNADFNQKYNTGQYLLDVQKS